MERVVNWIASSQLVSRQSTIVDLGCGNGITLVELVSLCDVTQLKFSSSDLHTSDMFSIISTCGSFHVNSTSVFHAPPQIVLKFGTVVERG